MHIMSFPTAYRFTKDPHMVQMTMSVASLHNVQATGITLGLSHTTLYTLCLPTSTVFARPLNGSATLSAIHNKLSWS